MPTTWNAYLVAMVAFWLSGWFIIVGSMLLLWILSLVKKDCSLVDPFWSFGFLLLTLWYLRFVEQPNLAHILYVTTVSVWGLRLALFLGLRWLRHDKEDRRYQAMRSSWGDRWWWVSLFQVFGLQGSLLLLLASMHAAALHTTTQNVSYLFWSGICVAWVGIIVESIADHQKWHFESKAAPQDVLQTGLWRWSRHPNYFGEALVWWGLAVSAFTMGAPWWVFLCPALMTFLLLKVSGIAMTEHSIAQRRPAYADYIRQTSAFIPWPPKT